MGLFISRIVLTIILGYFIVVVWTKNVNLWTWFQNKTNSVLPITKDKVSQAIGSDGEYRELAEGNRDLLEILVTDKYQKELQITVFGL